MRVSPTRVVVLFAVIIVLGVFWSFIVIVNWVVVFWYVSVGSLYVAFMLYVPVVVYLWFSSAVPFVILVVDSVLPFCVNVTCPFFIGLLLASCILMLIVFVSFIIAICFCGIMFTIGYSIYV